MMHRMNPDNGDGVGNGNKGGWEYSEMRSVINSDLYNALPSDLKELVINTRVVSGYDGNARFDYGNFVTNDKLYLLYNKKRIL